MTGRGPRAPAAPAARLLIVDDEAPQLRALCDTLGDEGFEVAGFTSAAEALAALRGPKGFDLLLTDLRMPDMDGIALLRAAQEQDRDLVAIMMTGHGSIDTAIEAMKAGALDYILKPFNLSVIRAVLARSLDVRRLRVENAALQRSVSEHVAGLEAANKELDAFSYSVSHDLRAPLRVVSGFCRVLLDEEATGLSGGQRRLLENIASGAARMGELIESLLRLSRASRQPLSQETVDLSTIVNDALEGLAKEREGRQVDVRISELPPCLGDPVLLRQVFANLLSNALKFTREKEKARIEVGCEVRAGETVYYVRDDGAGFDMRRAEKLFGAFQRLHRPERFEGTGIGLSIVQRIVRRHGGRIWAEAKEGEGAAFYLTLSRPG